MKPVSIGHHLTLCVVLIFLIPGLSLSAGLSSVAWKDLPAHIAGMDLAAPDNLIGCPPFLDDTMPCTTVVQWIENTRYQWREYTIGDQVCVVMDLPDPGPLNLVQAEVLLKASTLWMMPGDPLPGARKADFSLIDFQPVQGPDTDQAALNGVTDGRAAEYRSIGSPMTGIGWPDDPADLDAGPLTADEWYDGTQPDTGTGTFQAVIGADDRQEVGDTTVYPFNTIGFVFGVRQGLYYSGTAFLVSPYTALTNAHLVYDYETGQWSDGIMVYPGQYEVGYGQVGHPFGSLDAAYVRTNNLYATHGEVGYDFACIQFNTPVSGISTFMPLQFGFDMDNYSTTLHTAGYPAVVKGVDSLAQWYDYGLSSSYTSSTVARYYIDVTEGSSGSPVWLFYGTNRYVAAINAAGWEYGLPNGGPRLTKENQAVIQSWVGWVPVSAGTATPSPDFSNDAVLQFEPVYYLARYPDLAAAGYTADTVQTHWKLHGLGEGRQGTSVFDVFYYLALYPDLAQVFGTDYAAAHDHWLNNGIHEGRRGSAQFDVVYYLLHNPDLQAVFGADYRDAALHWIYYGMQESRKGAP